MFDKKIPFDKVSVGERIRVTTKTGRLVCFGTVHSVYPLEKVILVRGEMDPTLGVDSLKQVIMDHMYKADLYDFYAEKYDEEPGEDIETPVRYQTTTKDKTLIDGGLVKTNKIKKEAEETDASKGEEGDDKADKKADKEGEAEKSGKKDAETTMTIKDKEVDISKLPKEVQQQVKGTDSLDDDKVDTIMSKISDATRQALKNAGVRDADIYQMVVDVQKAVDPVLSKKRKKK